MSSSAQTVLDLSDPVIALESQPRHGVVQGQALPRGIADQTMAAAPYVIEKCLEHVEGAATLEESFTGTRFSRVKNPMLAHIEGTSPVAYAHPDLFETFLYDQSSDILVGCGLTMTGPNAAAGFDLVRDFITDRYDWDAPDDNPLFGESVKLDNFGTESVMQDYGSDVARMRLLVTPVNDNTGFVMSIFVQGLEG